MRPQNYCSLRRSAPLESSLNVLPHLVCFLISIFIRTLHCRCVAVGHRLWGCWSLFYGVCFLRVILTEFWVSFACLVSLGEVAWLWMWGFGGGWRVRCGGLHPIPHSSQPRARGYQCGCSNIHTCVRVTRDVTSAFPVGPLRWAQCRSVTATPDPGRLQPRVFVCVEIIIIANTYIFKKMMIIIITTTTTTLWAVSTSATACGRYVNFAMRWGTASRGASRRRATPKRDISLSGHWMSHLLTYSLSGGHDGAMLPINQRGLNGPLTSHLIFFSHMDFSLNTPTHYWFPMPN